MNNSFFAQAYVERLEDKKIERVRSKIAEIDGLKNCSAWGAEFQIWESSTRKIVKEVFGARGEDLFKKQGAVVLTDEAYTDELDGRKKVLEGLIQNRGDFQPSQDIPSSGNTEKRTSTWNNPWTVTIVGGVVVGIVLYFVLGIGKADSTTEIKGSIITSNQSGGNNMVVNNPPTQRTEEDFAASSLKNNFIASSTSSDEILHIELRQYPLAGSVNIWWGAMSLTPADYQINGKDVAIDFDKNQAQAIKQVVAGSADEQSFSFVVTYVIDSSRQ